MDELNAFLDTYGVVAACAIMLVKAMGVPIPIPGDVILLATAARVADGKVVFWIAFGALLLALIVGGTLQFLLARGPARRLLVARGPRIGLNPARLERIAAGVRRGGPVGIGLAVLTPGVRSAVVPACGLTGVPLALFLPGLVLGSTADLALHFALGLAGAGLLAGVLQPSPLLGIAALLLVGLLAWLLIARRRGRPTSQALQAWSQATCPVCLLVGSQMPLDAERAVRWTRAA
jgi:membrane protein DedA with SNARE-associated domain